MNDSVQHILFFSWQILIEYYCITSVYSNTVKQANVWLECFIIEIFCSSTCQRLYPSRNCSCFANELFSQRLVRQHLRSIHQHPKSLRQRPTGQFANVRYPVRSLIKETISSSILVLSKHGVSLHTWQLQSIPSPDCTAARYWARDIPVSQVRCCHR